MALLLARFFVFVTGFCAGLMLDRDFETRFFD